MKPPVSKKRNVKQGEQSKTTRQKSNSTPTKGGRKRGKKVVGSGYIGVTGPFHTQDHLNNNKLTEHLGELKKEKENIQNRLAEQEEIFQKRAEVLSQAKQINDQKESSEVEHNRSMKSSYGERLASQSDQAGNRFDSFLQSLKWLIVTLVKILYVLLQYVLRFVLWVLCIISTFLLWVIKGIWHAIQEFRKWIGMIIKSPIIWTIAAVLVVLLIIAGIICLIIFVILPLFGVHVGGDMIGGSEIEEDEKDKDAKCKNVTEITVSNFADFMKLQDFNNMLGDAYDKIGSYRPEFPSITEIPTFSIFNPLKGLQDYSEYTKNQFMNYGPVSYARRNINYIGNYILDKEAMATRVPREKITDGRCDNIILIDSEMINNANILKDRNINLAKTAINIVRPEDIEWTMPESDYKNKDIKKVPESLLSKPDENDKKINDKKTVVIPWIKKDNNYSLSCSDAYFKNNTEEKANILIDSADKKICTFNIESTPMKYTESRDRYKYTNDLSKFL